jgi:hypothetical protein
MIPTSSKTIERKRRILTAGTVLKRCFKGTIVPAFLHIQATVLTAVQVFLSFRHLFQSIPIQFGAFKTLAKYSG